MKKLYHIYLSNRAMYSRVSDSAVNAVADMCKNKYYRLCNDYNTTIEKVEEVADKKAVLAHLALIYAENHGIIEYHISHGKMVYYSSFPCEHRTIKAVVNLDTFTEARHYLKRYYKAYKSRVGGHYDVNYAI